MEDISEILKKHDIEVPEEKKDDFYKEFRSSYKSTAELDRLREKKDNLESTLKEYNSVIDNYKQIDIEGLKSEINTWKDKYEQADKEYKEKINKNILSREFEKFKFSSNTAKESLFNKALKSETIKFEDNNVQGIDSFFEEIKKNDPTVFVSEEPEEEPPKFTRQISNKTNKITGDPSKMDFKSYKEWRLQNFK